ncbi:hypothetical protein KKA08_09655, partial [bacterium]|nr:hypothetical protein [bacterium]
VAIFHIPVFTVGKWEPSRSLRYKLTPLFAEYGVDLVINGHNHSYERLEKEGITYIVTGGGGAPLYDKTDVGDEVSLRFHKGIHFCVFERIGKRLSGRVYTPNFEEIDQFTIEG